MADTQKPENLAGSSSRHQRLPPAGSAGADDGQRAGDAKAAAHLDELRALPDGTFHAEEL